MDVLPPYLMTPVIFDIPLKLHFIKKRESVRGSIFIEKFPIMERTFSNICISDDEIGFLKAIFL
jgi:hypothetical protein